NNVLLSAGADCKLIIWNVGTAEILSAISLPDLVFHVSWCWNGSRIVTTTKDKKIRIYDPKTGDMESVGGGGFGGANDFIFLANLMIWLCFRKPMAMRERSH